MSRVNIVKRIKIGGRWKMFSIPRNAKGNYDWKANRRWPRFGTPINGVDAR